MQKLIKVDFFHLITADQTFDFAALCSRQMEKDLQARCLRIRENYIRLSDSQKTSQIIEGDLGKIKMHGLPHKGSPTHQDEPLQLRPDEGLAVGRAFIFDPITRCLAIERNRNGASISEFEFYFNEAAQLLHPIQFDPVLKLDAYAKLLKLSQPKEIQFTVAGIQNPTFFKQLGVGASRVIDLMEEFGGPTMRVSLSAGRGKSKSLNHRVIEFASKMLKFSEENSGVTKLLLKGIDDDGTDDEIDLLTDRMTSLYEFQWTDRASPPYKHRRTAVAACFQQQRDELRQLFKA